MHTGSSRRSASRRRVGECATGYTWWIIEIVHDRCYQMHCAAGSSITHQRTAGLCVSFLWLPSSTTEDDTRTTFLKGCCPPPFVVVCCCLLPAFQDSSFVSSAAAADAMNISVGPENHTVSGRTLLEPVNQCSHRPPTVPPRTVRARPDSVHAVNDPSPTSGLCPAGEDALADGFLSRPRSPVRGGARRQRRGPGRAVRVWTESGRRGF